MIWKHEDIVPKNETYAERLHREADELDHQAKRMEGCSWMGDEPPWAHLYRDAADKRLLAAMLLKTNFINT